LFYRDQELVDVAWTRGMKIEEGYAYSLFLSHLYQPCAMRPWRASGGISRAAFP